MSAPHFCQALQRNSNPLKMCSREAPWSTCCGKGPLSRFTGFSSFLYDHSPCRPHSLSHLQQSSPSHAGPAAAIAAARPPGFGIHETEAAEISESASPPHPWWARCTSSWLINDQKHGAGPGVAVRPSHGSDGTRPSSSIMTLHLTAVQDRNPPDTGREHELSCQRRARL